MKKLFLLSMVIAAGLIIVSCTSKVENKMASVEMYSLHHLPAPWVKHDGRVPAQAEAIVKGIKDSAEVAVVKSAIDNADTSILSVELVLARS